MVGKNRISLREQIDRKTIGDNTVLCLVVVEGLHGLVGSGTADGVVGPVSLMAFFLVDLLVVLGVLVVVV